MNAAPPAHGRHVGPATGIDAARPASRSIVGAGRVSQVCGVGHVSRVGHVGRMRCLRPAACLSRTRQMSATSLRAVGRTL